MSYSIFSLILYALSYIFLSLSSTSIQIKTLNQRTCVLWRQASSEFDWLLVKVCKVFWNFFDKVHKTLHGKVM